MFTRHIQPSFSGGEVSPALAARVDSGAYSSWLKSACNFFVHPQGGASNRPGTAYMGTAKYTTPCRLIPFVISEQESYVLELGNYYIRVYTSAGQVLTNQGVPYEIVSPYAATDLQTLCFTQYDQKLFLAHPSYPLQCLTRTGVGQFTLAALPIQYGPFQPANTQTTRHLRVVETQETMQVEGVAASLRFSPVTDSRYIVYGYFNNEQFFMPDDYGLDLNQLVSSFNTRYQSQGLTAVNLGGVLQITSPQATGGDWNGAVLTLTYRLSFAQNPSFTTQQALSGGVNGGGTVPVGDVVYVLESDFDIFSPLQVGGRFSLTHPIQSQYLTGTISYNDVSSTLKTGSDWRIQLTGNWTGTVILEKSEDSGTTWQAVRSYSRTSSDNSLVDLGNLEDTGKMYYLRLRAVGITGQAGYALSAAAFVQEGVVVVTAFINARQVEVALERPCGAQTWTSDWAEGSFSPKNGYPSCVFFYQDRLGLAGTNAEPQTLWFSKTARYTDFGHARAGLLDNDALSLNLSGKCLNAIHQVAVAGRLFIFTSGSEWTLSSSGALTPYNLQIQQQSERGASRCAVVMVGNRALYVQARGGALRDFYYDYASASYTGEDLTLCAKHLFQNNEIREICHQQEPDNLVWCVLSNGVLASLTYVAEQNVCAWTHHTTQGYFRSVCTIPNRGYDELWVAVERNGACFVEKMLPRLASKLPQDQLFLDASVSKKSDTPFTQVEGLAHLEGCEVNVLADGNVLGSRTVSNGKIVLPHAMTCVHVGLGYQARLQTLPIVFATANGISSDQKKRLVSVTVQLADSRGGKVSSIGEEGEVIIQRQTETYNTPLALKTENYVLTLSGTHVLGPSLVLSQEEPLPITLLALQCRVA